MSRSMLLLWMLIGAVACSAVAVVYSTQLARTTYSEISRHQRLIDRLDVQWTRLQIEEGTFSEHGRIERAARARLGMMSPGRDDTAMFVR